MLGRGSGGCEVGDGRGWAGEKRSVLLMQCYTMQSSWTGIERWPVGSFSWDRGDFALSPQQWPHTRLTHRALERCTSNRAIVLQCTSLTLPCVLTPPRLPLTGL